MVFFRRLELYAAIRLVRTGARVGVLGFAVLLSAHVATGQGAAKGPGQLPASAASPAPVEDATAVPVAGVNPDENDDGLLSFHGLPATQTVYLVDGLDVTERFNAVAAGSGSEPATDTEGEGDSAEQTNGPSHGLARGRRAGAAYSFSVASVREVRVLADGYSVESGHGGGVVELRTQSGTDALHGGLLFRVRSSALAARNPLAIATSYADGVVTSGVIKPDDLRENYEASLGGPVPRARGLGFFYAFEGQRRGFPAISSPADPGFYTLTAIQRALLANRGLTPGQVNAGLNYVSSLTGATDRRADQTVNFGKLDWRVGPRVSVGVDYDAVRWISPAGLVDAPVVARGRASLGTAEGSIDRGVVRVLATFGPRLSNALSVELARDVQFELPQTKLPQEPGIGPGGTAPEVNIGHNGILFGTPAGLSKVAYPDERRVAVADTLTLSAGKHLLVLGGTFAAVRDLTSTLSNAAGTFRYDSGTTRGFAGGLVDFLTDYTFNVNTIPNGGCPSIASPTHLFCFTSFTQSFGEQTVEISMQEWAGFVQDTWKATAHLSVQTGLRYEYVLLPLPQQPNGTLDALFGARGATSVFPEDRNNLGPRVAVAWEPLGSGRGTVRLGGGVFYGRLPGATIRSALSDTGLVSATTRIRLTPSASIACPQVPGQGFGYPCSFLKQPPTVVARDSSAMVFDRRFRLPSITQASLLVERSLGRDTVISVGYTLNLDRHLPSSTDLNVASAARMGTFQLHGGTGAAGVLDGETFALPVYTARLTPSFGPVTEIESNVNGSYHGLGVTVAAHPLESLRVRGAFTWSKTIDFGPNLSAVPRTSGQLDPFTNGYDKGLSSLNYPWSLHVVAAWAVRAEGGRWWLRGWTVSPAVVTRAGRPYSLDLFGGTRLAGGHLSLNGSGGALYLPTVGRNTLRLPATVNVDVAASRGVRLRQGVRLRLSAEAFNVLNHRNVTAVVQRAYLVGTPAGGVTPLVFQSAAAIAAEGLNVQAFGTPNASGSRNSRERQVEFGVKVEF